MIKQKLRRYTQILVNNHRFAYLTILSSTLLVSCQNSPIKSESNTQFIYLENEIVASDFEINIDNSYPKIELRNNVKLGEYLEVRYAIDNEEPLNLDNYKVWLSKTLQEGMIVWARLFVKEMFREQYKIDAKAVKLEISWMPKVIDFKLEIDHFRLVQHANDWEAGHIELSPDLKLDKHLEIKFALNSRSELYTQNYQDSLPRVMRTNDWLWVGVWVKEQYRHEYFLAPTFIQLNPIFNTLYLGEDKGYSFYANKDLTDCNFLYGPNLYWLGNYFFYNSILPANFCIPRIIKVIGQGAFEKATILDYSFHSFNLYFAEEIWDDAFANATLPIEFDIPLNIEMIGKNAFKNAILPRGWVWVEERTNIVVVDQDNPYISCSIKKPPR